MTASSSPASSSPASPAKLNHERRRQPFEHFMRDSSSLLPVQQLHNAHRPFRSGSDYSVSSLNASALKRLLDHSVQLYRWRAHDTAIARLRELQQNAQQDACIRHAIHPLNAVHPGYLRIASAMSCAAPQRGIGTPVVRRQHTDK